MDIIAGERGSGKTTDIIKKSADTGYPILVVGQIHKEHIERMAKNLGYRIPEPLVAKRTLLRGVDLDGFLVDEINLLLPRLLDIDAPLKGMTVGGEDPFDVSFKQRKK